MEEWLAAGSAANYAKLEVVRSLNIPVVVNLVFAGFDKNGNLGVSLSQEKLERWFEHLEAANPYARVPADDEGIESEYEFQRAAVRFRYSFNVVKVSPNVSSVLDTVLYRAMRPTDPLEVMPKLGPESSFSQVEADVMEEALESLAIELGLDDAFTLFVLNPRRDTHGKMYGYRSGFSRAEKAILFEDENFRTTYRYGSVVDADGATRGAAGALERQEEPKPDMPANDPLTALNQPQLQWHEMEEASERWIAKEDARIGEMDESARMAEQAAGAEGSVYRRAVKMLEAGGGEKREIDAVFADSTSDEAPLLGQKARLADDFDENCLVDNWVASDRLAWIDLTAGPFTWGPVAGGAGVRTHSTLPAVSEMVEEYYQPVDDTYEQPAGGTDEEGFQDFVNQIQAERDVVQMLFQRHCGGSKHQDKLARNIAKIKAKVKAAGDAHMKGTDGTPESPGESFAGRPDLCEEILARQMRLEAVLLKANAIQGGPDPTEGPPKPGDKLAAMQADLKASGGDEDNPIFTRGVLGADDVSFAIDRSLAHLAATISTTLRQLVTPVAAGNEPSGLLLDDGHNPEELFAERVAFHVFTITEHHITELDELSSAPGTKNRSLEPKLQDLKDELLHLALPSQEFSFSFATMALADDPALAVAYASSLRVHARAGQGGKVQDLLALDAAELVHQLQHRAEGSDVLRSPNSRTRTVPIFIFRIDSDMPVFLERPGGAPTVSVGLGGMVVAAESNHTNWQTPLSCNGQPVTADLRDATKPLLAATARVLGGILPRHIAPSADGRGTATSDWLWAVGDSPLVATSPCRAAFGQVDADIIHRNYLAQALHVSSETVNGAILRLNGGADGSTHTRDENAAAAFKVKWPELVEAYDDVEKVWLRALSRAGRMDLDAACGEIRAMKDASDDFADKVDVVVRHMTELRCSNEVGVVDHAAIDDAIADGPVTIADIEDDLMLQLTASGFEVKPVEMGGDEEEAVKEAETEMKAQRAAARKAEAGSGEISYPPVLVFSQTETSGSLAFVGAGGSWRSWLKKWLVILSEALALVGMCGGVWLLKERMAGGSGNFRNKPKFN